MFRLLFLTFFGDCRADEHTQHHLHESPPSMTMPLIVLAILSVDRRLRRPAGPLALGQPLRGAFSRRCSARRRTRAAHLSAATEYALMGASVLVALVGLGVAYVFYIARPELPESLAEKLPGVYDLIFNKYYVDELYDLLFVRPTVALSTWLWRVVDVGVIDGLVNGTAEAVGANSGLWRRLQTGNVQHYAVSMLLGALAILGYYAWRMTAIVHAASRRDSAAITRSAISDRSPHAHPLRHRLHAAARGDRADAHSAPSSTRPCAAAAFIFSLLPFALVAAAAGGVRSAEHGHAVHRQGGVDPALRHLLQRRHRRR